MLCGICFSKLSYVIQFRNYTELYNEDGSTHYCEEM